MKLLFLTFNAIDDRSYGAAIRSNHLRDSMAGIGELHTLIIHRSGSWRLDPDWDSEGVRHALYTQSGASCAAWRQRARIRAWVSGIIREGGYDVIVARYLGLAFFVPRFAWQRLVIDADDIVKSLPSTESASVGRRLRRWVRNAVAVCVVRRAGHVWCVNPLDVRRVDAERVSIMRNVVRLPDPDRPRAPAVPGRILMVGLFEHPPNADGLRWFVREVFAALRSEGRVVELHAIGKCPQALFAELSGPGIVLRGYVADLQAEYDLASLVVAPIESGGGTQIKVIDALAHGRPLVASAFAHAGFANELQPGQHLLVCSDRAAWIAACNRVLDDADAAEAMATRGRAGAALFGPDRLRS
ncbi:MAG: glycosyltransferase family 4 protein, partial [Acidobacteriota bacterium]|nr:glycosyltransferase family 4 protein [Acidobacteriota bacterium]